ncbi:MAG TPA: hypothetical protein VE262_21635 [Blastocatellia bacterium]|nr:hypothetical protein [Blastocatellia bacterium]
MVEKPSKLQPAIVGGLIGGLLSSIPVISFFNACCCLWIVLGGVIAARMLIKRSPVLPITSGEGATAGALAGLVGAGVYLVLGVPLGILTQSISLDIMRQVADGSNNPELRETFRQMIQQMENQTFTQKLLAGLLQFAWFSVVMVAFSTLGGIIGVALFEKRKGQTPPPGGPGYPPGYYPGPGPGFTPPAPPPGPPAPPPNEPPYGGGQPPPY